MTKALKRGGEDSECFCFELLFIDNNSSYASFSIVMIVVSFLKTSLIKYFQSSEMEGNLL